MKIYLDAHEPKGGSRMIVEAELVKKTSKSLWVRLPDGNVVKRKITRDLPNEEGGKRNEE